MNNNLNARLNHIWLAGRMFRRLHLLLSPIILSGISAVAMAEGMPSGAETMTYRTGPTYAHINTISATQCAQACAESDQCRAWSHSGLDATPRCELKSEFGQAERRSGSLSGISARFTSHGLRGSQIAQDTTPPRPQVTSTPDRAPTTVRRADELLGGTSTSAQSQIYDRTPRTTRTTPLYRPMVIYGAVLGRRTPKAETEVAQQQDTPSRSSQQSTRSAPPSQSVASSGRTEPRLPEGMILENGVLKRDTSTLR